MTLIDDFADFVDFDCFLENPNEGFAIGFLDFVGILGFLFVPNTSFCLKQRNQKRKLEYGPRIRIFFNAVYHFFLTVDVTWYNDNDIEYLTELSRDTLSLREITNSICLGTASFRFYAAEQHTLGCFLENPNGGFCNRVFWFCWNVKVSSGTKDLLLPRNQK